METALLISIAGIVLVVAITAFAPKFGVAPPLILVVLGTAISFLPNLPPIEIEPEWILGGLLPPLLFSAAVNIPSMEFRRDLSLISGFSVLLVIVSALVVGVLLTWLIPGLPLALGIAVGAIVSPTDAVATSIVKKAGVSTRMTTVLEGESLLNDATALVLLRSAIAAVGTAVSIWQVGLNFLYAVAIALAVGWLVGRLASAVMARLRQTSSVVALSLVIPFAAHLPTEHLGGSGLVAAVIAGLVIGGRSPRDLSPGTRLAWVAAWKTVELVLESAIFLLMGLELATLVEDVRETHDSVLVAIELGAIAATAVLVVRAGFVAWSLWLLARRERRQAGHREQLELLQERLDRFGEAAPEPRVNRMRTMLNRRLADIDYLAAERFGKREGLILFWAGMRGAVTLAAAQTLPRATEHRSLLILIAFVVAAGTLVIQGATLNPLANRLGLTGQTGSDPAQKTALLGELNRAGLARLDGLRRPDGTPYSEQSLAITRQMLGRTSPDRTPDEEAAVTHADVIALRLAVLGVQREALLDLRDQGSYPSSLLDDMLTQLDADQLGLQLRQPD
ncbi:MAG: sodium:proton antiporter [Propionicimonas sp.]|uniref:cation:proton antiporter n=1 Tax=Propionicimonas sp. TaxID=1955623 RepID=UPI002B1EE79F|nr:sodium:proton antiporter [Propionicimonas sp.]MEA4943362.1 sodium:proton antiporter [Propionicimonas sp.]